MSRSGAQLALFETKSLNQVVNVAAVPQRSVFRYPGGKTWLVPRIRRWLRTRPTSFVEPFAGGGIVSLTVAAENLADQVVMVELDPQVSAVWKVLLEGDAEWLAKRIVTFELTPQSLPDVLNSRPRSLREKAFQTILKNRTFHGGILAPGSAPLKYGENGRGISSRWYASTLKRRILEIIPLRNRIRHAGDAEVVHERGPA